MPRRRQPHHRPFSLDGSHWRADGRPKVRYASQGEAVNAAEERGRESEVELGVYRCEFCGGWHMGRRSGRDD
ncbi:MAG TPA: hypothetical protein VHW47_03085 [Acidimicrobiales bacterium]|nr:hypothetical protein [Acidimicrobiales bacterium]